MLRQWSRLESCTTFVVEGHRQLACCDGYCCPRAFITTTQ